MDYCKLAETITERTKVIIPVDIGGVMCNYEKIFAAVESRKNLYKPGSRIQKLFDRPIVMSDAAHSFGASWCGKQPEDVADFTPFSLHDDKFRTGYYRAKTA
jgi:dTDP-4-amino-4,6-dideoxygalactose transaminase